MPPKRKASSMATMSASQRSLRGFGAVGKASIPLEGIKGKKQKLDSDNVHDVLPAPVAALVEQVLAAKPEIVQCGDVDQLVIPQSRIPNTLAFRVAEKVRQEREKNEAAAAASAFLAETPTKADSDIEATPKRKRVCIDEFLGRTPSKLATPATTPSKTPSKKAPPKKTPRKTPASRKKAAPKKPASTPSKASLFRLPSPPPSDPLEQSKDEPIQEEPATVEPSKDELSKESTSDDTIPEYLEVLIAQHTALLHTLLLCRSQNQSGVLPSFTTVKPQVEILSKHNFSLMDLRQIVWMSHYKRPFSFNPSGLKLVDYGAGKLCIAFNEDATIKLLHTQRLKDAFLRASKGYLAAHPEDIIPQAEVHNHLHKATINRVLHSKTQTILKDLKSGSAKVTKLNFFAVKKPTAPPGSRASSLQDRIRAKQAAAIAPPTAEELVRMSAECRVPEVTEILRGYRAKGQSVALKACVEVVRESVRSPLSAEEAEMAVRMASETNPWCEVKEAGGVAAVVFGKIEGQDRFN